MAVAVGVEVGVDVGDAVGLADGLGDGLGLTPGLGEGVGVGVGVSVPGPGEGLVKVNVRAVQELGTAASGFDSGAVGATACCLS